MRFFRDRMINPGEVVEFDVDAFDPDGDPLTYGLTPLPTGVTRSTWWFASLEAT